MACNSDLPTNCLERRHTVVVLEHNTTPFTTGWSIKRHLVMTGSEYDWDLLLDPLRSCLVVMENFSSFGSSRDVRL